MSNWQFPLKKTFFFSAEGGECESEKKSVPCEGSLVCCKGKCATETACNGTIHKF